MAERHHRYVWYDGSSKQSGGGQASISQRHMGSDVLMRICSEKRKHTVSKTECHLPEANDWKHPAYAALRLMCH